MSNISLSVSQPDDLSEYLTSIDVLLLTLGVLLRRLCSVFYFLSNSSIFISLMSSCERLARIVGLFSTYLLLNHFWSIFFFLYNISASSLTVIRDAIYYAASVWIRFIVFLFYSLCYYLTLFLVDLESILRDRLKSAYFRGCFCII